MATDLSTRVFKETRRAVDKFHKHSERELRKIKNLYIGARKRISGEIAEQWPNIVKEGATPFGLERLKGLQLGIDTQLGVLNQDLNTAIPQMVGDAGDMGIYRGQVELAQLLREFPDLHPTFGVLNTSAIDVYSGYALQLSQQYTAELTRQIQSALQMGLIDQKTTGELTTQIRQYLGAEFGKPAKAITYKARRIARTEMSRAYQAGHEAYGRSTDFIVGEVAHHNPMGPWPCAQCENIPEGTEFIYAEGDRPPYPLHSNCRCYTTYIYSKKLFTKEEMGRLRGMVTGVPVKVPVVPVWKDAVDMMAARRFAEKNLVTAGGKADYGKLALRSANTLNRNLDTLVTQYKVKPHFVGSTQAWNKWLKQKWPSLRTPPVGNPYAIATYARKGKDQFYGLTLNEKWWSSKKKLNELSSNISQAVKQGWFKDGSAREQIVHTFAHEYGHILDLKKGDALSKGIDELIRPHFRGKSLKEVIGGYAASDYESEHWAELFAMYQAKILSSALMKVVGTLLGGL